MTDILTGIIPVAPTPFHEDESLDLDGQRRIVDFLVGARADAVCVLANYSEQFSLDDAERRLVLDATVRAADGRLPVVVATSHYSARVAATRSREAASAGAAAVMLMPPFVGSTLRPGDDGVREFFHTVADGLDADIMVQDAPLSGVALPVSLLAELAAEIPRLRYAKVEVPGTAAKIAALGAAAGESLPGLFDGEEGVTLVPDLENGAVGSMASCVAPEILGDVVRRFRAGDRDTATRLWEDVLPLIHFENRQCGLAAAKALLAEGGVIASSRTRSPYPALSPATRSALLELARRRGVLALDWAR
ncbi:dihydrodipicolinate synthase family protein [Herbiconiux sp. KACC 21604]|uniref:dihydrodipicolinate synthase family protein n=1 Tax=unclassified Herbiconiux TaxID=2618217 RepID=UPI0014929A05|nr:dihydrodipicolinate synthase family protein [Herbiconiux sp. SALV-R1]QJU55219.1 dihydrodipicolinate synthase family protein [Herbiconiux sp. SALV-R1]WPO86384.1 dihydrodipicolinate synthase family protein [Herbiconiux sp. KACC 21604]